ncbi:TlpA disulfide reductase family protein [Carboxylicivirga sp. 1411-1]
MLAMLFLLGTWLPMMGQKVAEVSADDLLARVQVNNDTTYVINFWATWCGPCVDELPVFESEELHAGDVALKVLLVSLDFKSHKETKLLPFLRSRSVEAEVVLLDERNPNVWIDRIDEAWSGAIPATLVIKNGVSVFYEGELDLQHLQSLIATINHQKSSL